MCSVRISIGDVVNSSLAELRAIIFACDARGRADANSYVKGSGVFSDFFIAGL